jgi:hypothetical protein
MNGQRSENQGVAKAKKIVYFGRKTQTTMRLVACFILTLALSASAFSQSGPKAEKIKKYMDVMGTTKLMDATMDNMISLYKKNYPAVDSTFWAEYKSQFMSGELINMLIPVYDKHLTEEDLDALIAFYSTPTGQKIIKSLPEIMKESMNVGAEWGREIGTKLMEQLKAKGYSTGS